VKTKSIVLSTGLLLFLAGCTVSQEARIRELLTVQSGAFPRLKDIQVVRDRDPTDAFSLSIEQHSSLFTRKGSFPVFVLKGESLPINERFILAKKDRVTGAIDPQCEFEILENGELEIYAKTGISKERELPFIASDGVKMGYPIDYLIVSKKTYASASAEFLPLPIETVGKNGERIEALVSHPMGTRFRAYGTGFLPFERLLLTHVSGERTETEERFADETGCFESDLNPLILGKLGGNARMEVERTGEEKLILSYPWGTEIEKKTWKERPFYPMLFVANRLPEEQDLEALASLIE